MNKPIRFTLAPLALSLVAVAAQADEAVITAIHSLPATNDLMESYFAFVDDVNANGEGILQIQVRGGTEVVPTREQYNAVSRGIADLYMGPAGYYQGQVPEFEVISGGTVPADKLRAAGLHDALDAASRERTGVAFLGIMGTGYAFQFYLKDAPTLTDDGGIDLEGVKVRGGGSYAPMYNALGIDRIAIPAGEIYTALERGVVDGIGFTTIGISSAGWQDHLTHRIYPTWRQGNTILAINAETYDALTEEQQAYLMEMVAKHEMLAYEGAKRLEQADTEALGAAGVIDVELTGAGRDRLLAAYYDTLWVSVEEKLGAEQTGALRAIVEAANDS